MKTSALRNDILAQISLDIRHALTPSLPTAEKPIEDQRWELLNNARACRVLADCAKAAGEIGSAAEYVARGRAYLRTLREMEGN